MAQEHSADSPEKTQQRVEGRETREASAQSFQGGLHPVLQLQRTQGNRFVTRLVQAKRLTPGGRTLGVQSKESGQEPLQRQAEAGKEESPGKLPPDVQAGMEASFGMDFSGVRIHQGSQAASLGALAYTQGSDIHFAPGQYDPQSQKGRELLGHELTHVIQQSDGRVGTTGDVKGVPLNDDPGLEREADNLGARAARGELVGRGAAASPSGGGDLAQRKADPAAGEESSEEASVPVVEDAETSEAPAQLKVAGRAIQARAARGPIQRRPEIIYVPHTVHVIEPMTREEFRAEAMQQIFGGELRVEWRHLKDSYGPADSPVTVKVDSRLLRRQRGEVNKERGISVGKDGGVTGAKERAETFHAGPESGEKSALLQEIDRRYFEAAGDKTETKIKPGEKGKAEHWRMIRDEVLFQHEYIAKLPPEVKALIKFSIKGRVLTPADYDKLFAIAKKIEKMPPGQVGDYASKVQGSTTDLDAFEASLDKYIALMAERSQQSEEREKVQNKLIGLEKVYERYKKWKDMPTGAGKGAAAMVLGPAKERERKGLEAQLQAHDFQGITEFETYIEKFKKEFEQGAANIAKDLLAKYAGRIYRESERYKDPAEVGALHRKLGGVRAQFQEFEVNAKIWNDYVKNSQQARVPGQAHLRPKIGPREAEAARTKAEEARAAAQSQVHGMAGDHPIFQDDKDLPDDKKINKEALARASESELGALLQGHINRRMNAIGEARAEIEGKSELIYKMDKLMPLFYAKMGIRPDSIHDRIIQDKMKEDAIVKLVKGIAFAIVAIALAIVTFGTATPAILAAGAGVLGAGLGVYQAYESYQEYVEEKKLADVGFAKDPSVIWLVIAVAGAALDMGAAAKAMSLLGKAGQLVDKGGDLKPFVDLVRKLEKEKEITSSIARAAEKAAAARKGFADATKELTRAMSGKLYSFPGPLADPDVFKAVVKMAYHAIKTKVYDAQRFIDEIRLARAALGDLTPEELAKAKQAWEEAKLLVAAEEAAEQARNARLLQQIPDAAKLNTLIGQAGDAAKLERLLKVFPEAELDNIFAQLTDTGRLVNILDHAGVGTGAGMIRGWMGEGAKGIEKMNKFLGRLAAGGKELSETATVGAKSLIIDSNTAIALVKDTNPALYGKLQPGEEAWVAYIKSLPADTELRVANVTVGEIQGGVINVKGVPITVARESTDYQKVLKALADKKVGTDEGFADRGLIADALFAQVEQNVIPKLVTGDKNAVKNLARMMTPPIDLVKAGGYPGLVAKYGQTGFEVTIEGRKLLVVPLPLPKKP